MDKGLSMDFEKSAGGILIPTSHMIVGGVFHVEHIREGELIDEFDCPNLVVNQGLDHLLNTVFTGSTQVNPWYLGLFEGNYTPVAAVTAATITAASTECVAYSESTRQEFVEAGASAQQITNSANKATFTINATKTIYGAFLVSNNTKSSTAGTLFSAARFAAAKAVVASDQILLTYTFTASSV